MAKKQLGKTPPLAVKSSKSAAPKAKAVVKAGAKPAVKAAKPVSAAKSVSKTLAKTPAKKLALATKPVAKAVVKPSAVAVKGGASKTPPKAPAKAPAKVLTTPAMKARAAALAAPAVSKVATPVKSPVKPTAVSAKPAVVTAKSATASSAAGLSKSPRPVTPLRPGVKNGDAVVAKIALKPAVVAALAAERGSPVMKLVKSSRPRPEPVPVRLPPAPVRSDSKMARNRAGISPRELEHFRDLLFEKRRELTGDVSSMETTALHNGNGNLSTLPMHMADAGTDNYEQEFTLGLVEKDRKLLRDINVALAKIQDGSYGICEGTGKPIAKPRLEAQPWAKYSIEHARALERPQFRRAF